MKTKLLIVGFILKYLVYGLLILVFSNLFLQLSKYIITDIVLINDIELFKFILYSLIIINVILIAIFYIIYNLFSRI